MQDIFCALRWLEEHAAAHRAEPKQIFVYGDSAGGHYAMLAGLIQNSSALQEYYGIFPMKNGIRGIAVSCPMYEIYSLLETRSLENLLMRRMLLPGKRKTDKRYLDNVSIPAILAREEFPEIFLLTTPTDEVLYEAAKKLHVLLEEKGVCHRYQEYTSEERTLGHVFMRQTRSFRNLRKRMMIFCSIFAKRAEICSKRKALAEWDQCRKCDPPQQKCGLRSVLTVAQRPTIPDSDSGSE